MANNNWNNYTEKTATPVDADEVMVRDSADGKNKKLLFGTFWKWEAARSHRLSPQPASVTRLSACWVPIPPR